MSTNASTSTNKEIDKQHEELIAKMEQTKLEWDQKKGAAASGGDEEDETDRMLSEAIELAIQQGKGWKTSAEKEEYLKMILDDDFIPPLFASTPEELERSGLAEAFTSLVYEGQSPTQLYLEFKKKGNDAFANGQRNEAKNVQYYRDAINHYYEALAWAKQIQPTNRTATKDDAVVDVAVTTTTTSTKPPPSSSSSSPSEYPDDPVYTEMELDEIQSTLCANAALAHLQLRNWGHARDDSNKALAFNKQNIKAWYRLAKSYQMLQHYEEAGDAIDHGLEIDASNRDLQRLQTALAKHVQHARKARQQRERARAERVARVKQVWKHCQGVGGGDGHNIKLGRITLVATVTDDEEEHDDDDHVESKWHSHHPHTGLLPSPHDHNNSITWTWPCLFLYPSHAQSDFIPQFAEMETIAQRLAQIFPILEDDDGDVAPTTSMPWDTNNEFVCSNLAVYFEVHSCYNNSNPTTTKAKSTSKKTTRAAVIHPEEVELLCDQGSTMRFYEASRALKGDEGADMAQVARAMERKHLHQMRKAWIQQHGSLWAKPDPCPVVRVHPAATLRNVLTNQYMVVPNFVVTFILFPEHHPAHEAYLKEHKYIGLVQPSDIQ